MTNKPKTANKKRSQKTADDPNKEKINTKLKTKDQDGLILRYLTKLKKLFHNKNQETQPVSTKGNELQEVMYNMVSEALDYGYRNKILEKRGNCFMFKQRGQPRIRPCQCNRCRLSCKPCLCRKPLSNSCKECARMQLRDQRTPWERYSPNILSRSKSYCVMKCRSRMDNKCGCRKCRGKLV